MNIYFDDVKFGISDGNNIKDNDNENNNVDDNDDDNDDDDESSKHDSSDLVINPDTKSTTKSYNKTNYDVDLLIKSLDVFISQKNDLIHIFLTGSILNYCHYEKNKSIHKKLI